MGGEDYIQQSGWGQDNDAICGDTACFLLQGEYPDSYLEGLSNK